MAPCSSQRSTLSAVLECCVASCHCICVSAPPDVQDIGTGSFGQVLLAKNVRTNEQASPLHAAVALVPSARPAATSVLPLNSMILTAQLCMDYPAS